MLSVTHGSNSVSVTVMSDMTSCFANSTIAPWQGESGGTDKVKNVSSFSMFNYLVQTRQLENLLTVFPLPFSESVFGG